MLGHRELKAEDYLTILKRRWWIIALPMMLLPIVAIGLTYILPAQYVSQTLILIDQPKVPNDVVKSVVTESVDSRLAYMTEQIMSRSTVQPIVEKYNLYATQHLSIDARVDLARKNIQIQPVHSEIIGSNGLPGFRIVFTANDPHTAQQVCTDITSLFTGNNLRSREQAAQGTTDFLKEQLDGAKRNLDDQDAKLAAFQSMHSGMLPEDSGSNMNILGSLSSRFDAATQQLQTLENNQSVLEAMLAQQPQSNLTTTSPAQSPLVQQKQLDDLQAQEAELSAHYQPDYPDVKAVHRKIQDLQKEMAKAASAPPPVNSAMPSPTRADSVGVQALRAQLRGIAVAIQAKRKEQAQLEQQIRGYQGRIQSTPEVEAQYKQLTRDYQTAQAFYDSLQVQMNKSQMATDLEHRQQGETFSVLDSPNFPFEPTFPKQSIFAAGGLAAGLALGVLIVAFLEYKDTALRTERDVWEFTQLPTLAVIAWCGNAADLEHGKLARLKRLFGRKAPKKLLANAPG